ncbi:MAG: tripartite tricarboxylate transporter permease [Spirochaetia bacterium]|nr:tripartite tricarboxylate transporter permease [Spirochaetia bacterium]
MSNNAACGGAMIPMVALGIPRDSTTAIIEAIPKEKITSREPELLIKAKGLLPKLFIKKIDVLIVDTIGKNFSGAGMDANITGSFISPFASGGPEVERYVILDLSKESHGNAMGAGRADFMTKRLFDKIDFDSAYPNALTCKLLLGAKIPIVLKNDEDAIKAGIFTCDSIDFDNPRIVRIHDSSHVTKIMVSEALSEEVEKSSEMKLLSEFQPMTFDEKGNLDISSDFWNRR